MNALGNIEINNKNYKFKIINTVQQEKNNKIIDVLIMKLST